MNDLEDRLRQAALKASVAFCYPCYREAPNGRCQTCHSDDLMRLLPGLGCEWGTEWLLPILLAENITAFDAAAAFEAWVEEVYPETVTIGWITLDTVSALKQLDPVSWDLEVGNWVDSEVSDGRLITFDHGATYYDVSDLETYLSYAESHSADEGDF